MGAGGEREVGEVGRKSQERWAEAGARRRCSCRCSAAAQEAALRRCREPERRVQGATRVPDGARRPRAGDQTWHLTWLWRGKSNKSNTTYEYHIPIPLSGKQNKSIPLSRASFTFLTFNVFIRVSYAFLLFHL